jgi:chromosome segregation ATPase
MNFRTSFNGFNREDVVHFVEYLNARHTAEINQLKAELDLLRSRADAVRNDDQSQELDRLRQENEHLNHEVAMLNSRLETAYAQQTTSDPELQAKLAQLQQQYDALKAEKESSGSARELEAYRRAERTERVARERAEQVYHQVNGVLADASGKVDIAATQLGELTDRVSAQLAQLQEAVTGSRQALADASATLYAIRPTGDNS